jgi:hypothetical protein
MSERLSCSSSTQVRGRLLYEIGREPDTTAIGYIPLTAYFVYLGSQIEGFSLTDPIVWIGAIGFVIAVLSVRRVLRQASPESS